MKHNTTTIWVCVDCMMTRETGEPCENVDCNPWSRITDDQTVTFGIIEPEHTADCDTMDCDCAYDSFSTAPCEGCGTDLAGARYAYTLWDPTIRVTHQVTIHNELRLYVEAPKGTHASTMAKHAREYLATLPKPLYREWNGSTRSGQWCRHLGKYAGYYTPAAAAQLDTRKLYWRTIVIPEGI